MKFTKLIIIGTLLGSISVEAHRLNLISMKDEAAAEDADADSKQPKVIDPNEMKTELKEAQQANVDEANTQAKALKL